jgi:hypothetical protein
MQNYKDLVLENQIGNLQMLEPIQDGTSKIDKYPLDVVEKLGKYQFIYDYKVPSLLDSIYNVSLLKNNERRDTTMVAPSGIWSGGFQSYPQPIKINSEPQVGSFSKGNIVNVLRFDTNNNAIIENPNYVQPDPNAPKSFWSGFSAAESLVYRLIERLPLALEQQTALLKLPSLAAQLELRTPTYGDFFGGRANHDLPEVETAVFNQLDV